MIDWLAKLLGYVMRGCSWLAVNNYVIALLFFAIVMQLVLLIFSIKQHKNMVKQASLRPKEMAIRNKYRGRTDQATMKKANDEIMQLYQNEGYSQLAGCLPMLLQLIIIFPIYQVVIRPLEFVAGLSETACAELGAYVESLGVTLSGSAKQVQLASWLLKGNSAVVTEGVISQASVDEINALEKIPDMTLFGVDLGVTPFEAFGEPYWWLIFIPIVNLGLTYLSQFLSKKYSYQNTQQEQAGAASSMKMMMYIFPLMTMFITFGFASAIGIYWIFRTLLSMLQQYILPKIWKYPVFTEEDYKKAEKALKGTRKDKKTEAEYVVQPGQYRSLHHIDDDE